MERLNLDIIKRSYPNSVIMGINEVYYPKKGWVEIKGKMMTPYTSKEEFERRIKLCIYRGAEAFNFNIKDEYGQIKEPDYFTKELVVKSINK